MSFEATISNNSKLSSQEIEATSKGSLPWYPKLFLISLLCNTWFAWSFLSHARVGGQSRKHNQLLDGFTMGCHGCRAPLPNLLSSMPLSANHPKLQQASDSFREELKNYFDHSDLDSMAIAVVTASGSIFEDFHGLLTANETAKNGNLAQTVDRYSIYRIASISKLFTTLGTLKLREQGALNL